MVGIRGGGIIRLTLKIVSVAVVLLLIGTACQSAVAELYDDGPENKDLESRSMDEVPPPFLELAKLASDLQNATPVAKRIDSDGDTLWDPVEVVIGTDPRNPDSDSDRLRDDTEVFAGIDPNNPDSNRDRYPDYLEISIGKPDLDGDGVPNAWDWDNDDDGVMDDLDLSPMARTGMSSSYHLDINTTGKPTYIDLQIRTRNPNNLHLINQDWDWPYDDKGSMMDLDNSANDVKAVPSLMLRSDVLPSQEEVAQYGVVVSGDLAYLPMFPTVEFGNVVAFRSRLFYPETATPLNLSMDLELIWTINGNSDFYLKSMMAPTGSYVTSGPDGSVKANSSTVAVESRFEWDLVGDDQVALRASNGKFLTLLSDMSIRAADDRIGRNSSFHFTTAPPNLLVLKAANNKYLTVKADGALMADAVFPIQAHPFLVGDEGVGSRVQTLVTYKEDFMLTGLSVDESWGADYAVIYGQDPEEVLAGNLILSYDFLRNATTSVYDIPSILADHNISLSIIAESFGHEDAALQWLTANATMAALKDLPDDTVMPMVFALVDRRASMDLCSLTTTNHILGNDLKMDLTTADVVTTKSMKTPWYDTNGIQPLEFEDIIEEVRSWDLDDASLTITTGLLLAWNVGESEIIKVNEVETHYFFPEKADGIIDQTIAQWAKIGIRSFGILTKYLKLSKAAYAFVHFVEIQTIVKTAEKTSWSLFKGIYRSLNTGKSIMGKVGKFMGWVGIAVEVVMGFFNFFTMADAMDWQPIGVMCAAIYSVAMAWYGASLAVLAIAGGPVGAIIVAVLALIDIFVVLFTGESWLSHVMEEIIEWIYDMFTKTETRCDVDIGFVNSSFDVDDYDGNGIDVGDRLTFSSNLFGNVWLTEEGGWNDLIESYIIPQQIIVAPAMASSASGGTTTNATPVYLPWLKSTLYSTSAWVETGIPMVNFPLIIGTHTDYQVYYDNCSWFLGWNCDRESQVDSADSVWTLMHFDVMPGSIDEFARWRGIVSNDWDGDGLNNTQEAGTNMWLWDTDGDGLGDAYERGLGGDPLEADTDGDGLDDRYEYIWGLNLTDQDSDRDGLTDYLEWSGWVITFDYFGTEFNWNINSDYATNNTDEDDLTDFMEWRCLLNPRTNDTNGDGVLDQLWDYFINDIEHDLFFTIPSLNEMANDIEVDDDGSIYVSYCLPEWTGGGVVKFSKGLVQLAHWTHNFSNPTGLFIDSDGFLWVADSGRGLYQMYTSNGTVVDFIPGWYEGGSVLITPLDVVLDSEGNIYSLDNEISGVQKIHRNGTLIGIYNGSGSDRLWYAKRMDIDDDDHIYVTDYDRNRIQVLDRDLALLDKWGKSDGTPGTGLKQFNGPWGICVDGDGNVLVTEKEGTRVQKFDHHGNYLTNFTLDKSGTRTLLSPQGIGAGGDHVFVCDGTPSVYGMHRFFNNVTFVPADPPTDIPDLDGDGLPNTVEVAGWEISVADSTGLHKSWVTSDPFVVDSDQDGLNDTQESVIGSDPRSTDTDGDGVPDAVESAMGLDPTHWDTDGEGLADGIELTFDSDPKMIDTDSDGLSDYEEFLQGTDPNAGDTDLDGLNDYDEVEFRSSPIDPDSDDDFMFDSIEEEAGTLPNETDSDGDGIKDGFEILYNTDPTNGDSDGDSLSDGLEVSLRMDPMSNDTDEDGMLDGVELDLGLNPRNGDSDSDGVPDGLDTDHTLTLESEVILVMDEDAGGDVARFALDLARSTNVVVVTPTELLENNRTAPYIVLVGGPDGGNGTAGGLIRDILGDAGDALDRMLASDADRLATRHGYWTDRQTIVMLSHPIPSDHIMVLGMLKSSRWTASPGSVEVQFMNPRSCFKLDEYDVVIRTDAIVWTKLDEMVNFTVGLDAHNETSVGWTMDTTTGLGPAEVAMGKYLKVEVSENLQNETGDLITGAFIKIMYTEADLDLTGDGDANDPKDLNEGTLALYVLDEGTGNWTRLDASLDWVDDTGLNTTDFVLHGRAYAGHLWANVTHLSLFGIAARRSERLPTVAFAGGDLSVTEGDAVTFDGSASSANGTIVSYVWTFEYEGRTVTLEGAEPTFTFKVPGKYTVILTVTDSEGQSDDAQLLVTVLAQEEGEGLPRLLLIGVLIVILAILIGRLRRHRRGGSRVEKVEEAQDRDADVPDGQDSEREEEGSGAAVEVDYGEVTGKDEEGP